MPHEPQIRTNCRSLTAFQESAAAAYSNLARRQRASRARVVGSSRKRKTVTYASQFWHRIRRMEQRDEEGSWLACEISSSWAVFWTSDELVRLFSRLFVLPHESGITRTGKQLCSVVAANRFCKLLRRAMRDYEGETTSVRIPDRKNLCRPATCLREWRPVEKCLRIHNCPLAMVSDESPSKCPQRMQQPEGLDQLFVSAFAGIAMLLSLGRVRQALAGCLLCQTFAYHLFSH